MQLSVCYFKMILNDTWRLFISELCIRNRKLHLEDISRLNMTSVAERLLNATTRVKPRGKTPSFNFEFNFGYYYFSTAIWQSLTKEDQP